MIDRSDEIIKQLNRLANDRNLAPQARNKVRDAAQHIKDLHGAVKRIKELYFKLKEFRNQDMVQNNGRNE